MFQKHFNLLGTLWKDCYDGGHWELNSCRQGIKRAAQGIFLLEAKQYMVTSPRKVKVHGEQDNQLILTQEADNPLEPCFHFGSKIIINKIMVFSLFTKPQAATSLCLRVVPALLAYSAPHSSPPKLLLK